MLNDILNDTVIDLALIDDRCMNTIDLLKSDILQCEDIIYGEYSVLNSLKDCNNKIFNACMHVGLGREHGAIILASLQTAIEECQKSIKLWEGHKLKLENELKRKDNNVKINKNN